MFCDGAYMCVCMIEQNVCSLLHLALEMRAYPVRSVSSIWAQYRPECPEVGTAVPNSRTYSDKLAYTSAKEPIHPPALMKIHSGSTSRMAPGCRCAKVWVIFENIASNSPGLPSVRNGMGAWHHSRFAWTCD